MLHLLNNLKINEFQNILYQLKNLKFSADLIETYEFFLSEKDKLDSEDLNSILQELKDSFIKHLQEYLKTKYNSIILRIEVGQGGLDAQDWTNILFESYINFLKLNNIKYNILELNEDDTAGITAASIEISSNYAYYFFKYEEGSHRLERVSPFNAKKKVQTSNCLVKILPNLKISPIKIDDKDLVIKRMRAGGPGGQFTNKVETAIVLKHIPTGIIIKSSSSKSQHQNLENAITILKAELLKREEEKINIQQRKIHKNANKSVIRTYDLTLHYIKDHRTGKKVSKPERFFKGEILPFLIDNLVLALKENW